jgi:hypothetical protein
VPKLSLLFALNEAKRLGIYFYLIFSKKKSTLTPNITKSMDLSQVRKALHHFHRSKPTFISAQHVF